MTHEIGGGLTIEDIREEHNAVEALFELHGERRAREIVASQYSKLVENNPLQALCFVTLSLGIQFIGRGFATESASQD